MANVNKSQLVWGSNRRSCSKCILFVGGSGDRGEDFIPIMKSVSEKRPDISCCAVTFSVLTEVGNALDTQAEELVEVCRELHRNGVDELDIFATSMGTYSTCFVLANKQLTERIKTVILFDPADYYLHHQIKNLTEDITWAGYMEYNPEKPVVSDLLKGILGNATVNVIHLTVRCYTPKGYVAPEYKDRAVDYPFAFPRLNTAMVHAIYAKLPKRNKGVYTEISGVPHGFFRDGDVAHNQMVIIDTVCQLLPKSE